MIKQTEIIKRMKKAEKLRVLQIDDTYLVTDGFMGFCVENSTLEKLGLMDFNGNIKDASKLDLFAGKSFLLSTSEAESKLTEIIDRKIILDSVSSSSRYMRLIGSEDHAIQMCVAEDKFSIFESVPPCRFYIETETAKSTSIIFVYSNTHLVGFLLPLNVKNNQLVDKINNILKENE